MKLNAFIALLSIAFSSLACVRTPSRPSGPSLGSEKVAPSLETVTDAPRAQAKGSATTPPEERASQRIRLIHPRQTGSWLGVELRARPSDSAGVEVVHVFRGSPAEGVLRPGDILLTLDGETLASPSVVPQSLSHHVPGERVGVGFLRDGAQRLSTLILEGLPDAEDRARLEWIGRPAPEIASVVTFQGEDASLEELRGKVVVLEFWERYCGACRMMAPQLDEWHRTLSPAGLRVVGITMDTPLEATEAAAEAHMSYSLVSDLHGEIVKKYHVSQVPMLVLVDRTGVVRDVVIGYQAGRLRDTERLLEALLAEPRADERAN